MSKKIVIAVLAFLFLVVPVFSMIQVPAYATTGWGTPTNITNDPLKDIQSVITHDPVHTKGLHVAWVREMLDADETSWEIFYTNSTDYTEQIEITDDQIQDWNPMIDMDANGVVHIVWVKQISPLVSDIFYTNSTNWNIQVNVSRQEKGTHNWLPTLVVEKNTGVPHIAWVAAVLDLAENIWYRKGPNGPIQPVVQTNGFSIEPSITIDAQKNVHVVWAENGLTTSGTYQIRYTNSTIWPATDVGDYVNVSKVILTAQINFRRPDIALDKFNRAHVTFYSNISGAQVYYTLSPFWNNTWFLTPILASLHTDKNEYPSIKVSSTVNPIIIHQANSQYGKEIYAIDYNGTWAPIDISNNAYADSLEWSSIGALDMDASDSLYATYYTYVVPAVGGPGNWEVFVVTGSITGPGIPGFEFASLLVIALTAAIIWYSFKRKPTELLFK